MDPDKFRSFGLRYTLKMSPFFQDLIQIAPPPRSLFKPWGRFKISLHTLCLYTQNTRPPTPPHTELPKPSLPLSRLGGNGQFIIFANCKISKIIPLLFLPFFPNSTHSDVVHTGDPQTRKRKTLRLLRWILAGGSVNFTWKYNFEFSLQS